MNKTRMAEYALVAAIVLCAMAMAMIMTIMAIGPSS